MAAARAPAAGVQGLRMASEAWRLPRYTDDRKPYSAAEGAEWSEALPMVKQPRRNAIVPRAARADRLSKVDDGVRIVQAPSRAFPDARHIVDTATRAAVATDPDNVIVRWNDESAALLGLSAREVIGHNLQDVIRARDTFGNSLCRHHCAFHSMVRAGAAPENFELDLVSATGERVRVAVSVVVVLGPLADEYSLVYLMTPIRRRRRADEAIERVLAERDPVGRTPTGAQERGRRHQPRLTSRQKEALALMVLGRNSMEMAEEMGVSVNTVRSHVQAVLKALQVSTRLEAVSRALKDRLL